MPERGGEGRGSEGGREGGGWSDMTRVTMKKGRLEGSLKKIIIKIKPFTGYYLLVSFLFILSFSFSLRLSVSV